MPLYTESLRNGISCYPTCMIQYMHITALSLLHNIVFRLTRLVTLKTRTSLQHINFPIYSVKLPSLSPEFPSQVLHLFAFSNEMYSIETGKRIYEYNQSCFAWLTDNRSLPYYVVFYYSLIQFIILHSRRLESWHACALVCSSNIIFTCSNT